jgi:hypothetical protein
MLTNNRIVYVEYKISHQDISISTFLPFPGDLKVIVTVGIGIDATFHRNIEIDIHTRYIIDIKLRNLGLLLEVMEI